MTPNIKFAVKCVGFALYSLLTALAAANAAGGIDQNALITALIAAGIAGLGYAGIGYKTSLEAPGK